MVDGNSTSEETSSSIPSAGPMYGGSTDQSEDHQQAAPQHFRVHLGPRHDGDCVLTGGEKEVGDDQAAVVALGLAVAPAGCSDDDSTASVPRTPAPRPQSGSLGCSRRPTRSGVLPPEANAPSPADGVRPGPGGALGLETRRRRRGWSVR